MNIHDSGLSNGAVSSEVLPEFFGIYESAMCSERMQIPPAFIKSLVREMPRTVTLKAPSGQSWQVNTNKVNEHYFFQKGWPEFVQENSLANGDFLTFSYVGHSNLNVTTFAINGCVKSGIRFEDLQENAASEPETPMSTRSCGGKSRLKRSRARKSLCLDTSFTVLLGKHCTRGGSMNIPTKFCNVYLKKSEFGDSRTVTLRMNDSSWPVRLSYFVDRVKLSRGWAQFVKDNSLKRGNLCNFELIDRKDLVFNVSIC